MDGIRKTEGQQECVASVHILIYETTEYGSQSHLDVDLRVHDHRVVKWFADCHMAVMDHDNQKQKLHIYKENH